MLPNGSDGTRGLRVGQQAVARDETTAAFPMLKMCGGDLAALIRQAPRHLRPILRAIRNDGIGLAIILSNAGSVDFAAMLAARPTAIIIGDDTDAAIGPLGFDCDTLRAAFAAAGEVLLVPGAPRVDYYAKAAAIAGRERRHVVVVETRRDRVLAWAARIRAGGFVVRP